MNRNRLIATGIIAAIVVAAAGGWVLAISPVLDQISTSHAQQVVLATTNSASAARLVVLKKQFDNIADLRGKLSTLQSSIPAGADIQNFLAEITSLSSATGVSLTNLTVGSAATYVAPVVAVAPVAAATATAGASPSPSPSAASATATTAAPATPAGPSSRLVVIPITVLVKGNYSQVTSFSGALQSGARLFMVTALTLNGSTTDSTFTGKMEGSIFALPAQGASVSTQPGSAGPTVTPTSSATPTPSASPSAEASATPKPSATPTPSGSPTTKP